MVDKTKAEPKPPEFDPEMVRDVSEAVYRLDLGKADVASMISKDKDGGVRLRRRAGAYDGNTIKYLSVLKAKGLLSGQS